MHNQRTNRCCGTARPRWHEASPARSSLPAWCSVQSPLHHGRAFPSAATQTNAHKRPSQSFLFIIKCSPHSASIKTFHLNHPPFYFIFFYSIILFACVSQCHSVCWANRVTILAQGCECCLRAALFYYGFMAADEEMLSAFRALLPCRAQEHKRPRVSFMVLFLLLLVLILSCCECV